MPSYRSLVVRALVAWAAAAGPVAAVAQHPAPRARRSAAARPSADSQRVVFVCEHGTVKSVVAAALFNKLARERGLAAVAVSRGTAPDRALPPLVRDGLLADGAGPWRARPRRLTSADVPGAALLVSFDQPIETLVAGRAPVRRWDGTPSVMRDYATGRDSILSRVTALVAELSSAAARGVVRPRGVTPTRNAAPQRHAVAPVGHAPAGRAAVTRPRRSA